MGIAQVQSQIITIEDDAGVLLHDVSTHADIQQSPWFDLIQVTFD